MAIIFALRLTKSVRRIEKFNQTLATTVTQVKEELTHTLQNHYQLEMENTRL